MFRGSYNHNLDDKGRMALPSQFKKRLHVDEEPSSVIITKTEECLSVYPLKDWEALEAKFMQLPQLSDPKVAAYKRYLIGNAREVNIDKAGRILLPPELRERAQITGTCTVVGQLSKFEIWSTEKWEAFQHEASDQLPAITEAIAEYGITL